jgi:hypothetical protein
MKSYPPIGRLRFIYSTLAKIVDSTKCKSIKSISFVVRLETSKSGMKYNFSVVKLASLFPLLMLFLTLAKGESSYSFASTSHQISFSQEFTRLSDESAVTAKINSNIAKENSDSSKPFSKYPFSENTKNEKEDEKEDDKEKDHVNPLNSNSCLEMISVNRSLLL